MKILSSIIKPTHKPITPFQWRVYAALLLIPRGSVTTYGLLARYLGCGSAQAVGQALRRNPFAPDVPCHRVITSNLCIGGFSGQREGEQIAKKLTLLTAEGVEFHNSALKDPRQIFHFPT
ncbi:MGMT family protein [Chrysiogenes arsenatis]|uniref:MGMT family protein n=1 Tax=Chrysiogenes arsenatis TaxID=309797 RepID=UPI0004283E70|nr:MGMT family protein [Chrysiogenes arsenatis]